MLDVKKSLEMLEIYKNTYNYDTAYMEEMLNVAPSAYEVFEAFLPMATYSKAAPLEVINIARIASIKCQDCGTCTQLYIDLALEAGVDANIVKEIMFHGGENLPDDLKLVYEFTIAISNNETIKPEIYEHMNQIFSREVMSEIALAIAATKVFPSIKRVLNYFETCKMVQIKV